MPQPEVAPLSASAPAGTNQNYDLVIAGAGMVGVMQALLLVRLNLGWRILVLEQGNLPALDFVAPSLSAPSFDSRRLALSRGTVAVLQQLGLWSASLAATAITDIQVWEPGKLGRALLSASEQGLEALGYAVTAADLGSVLMAAGRAEPAISWLANTRIAGLQPLPTSWQLDLCTQQGSVLTVNSCIQTSLLIVAEGAHSPTRQRLGITHQLSDYQQTACVVAVEVANVTPGLALEAFLPNGSIALLPLSATHMTLIWVLPTELMQDYQQADAAVRLAVLQQALGRRLQLLSLGNAPQYYPLIDQRITEQVRPHVVVMGNAAHTLHPIAGQGFNLAVRDMLALVELLRLNHYSDLPLGDLSALLIYAQQRSQDQQRIQNFCHGVVNGFRSALPGIDLVRRLLLLGLDLSPAVKVTLAQRLLAPRPAQIQAEIQAGWQQSGFASVCRSRAC